MDAIHNHGTGKRSGVISVYLVSLYRLPDKSPHRMKSWSAEA